MDMPICLAKVRYEIISGLGQRSGETYYHASLQSGHPAGRIGSRSCFMKPAFHNGSYRGDFDTKPSNPMLQASPTVPGRSRPVRSVRRSGDRAAAIVFRTRLADFEFLFLNDHS
jgi:hypothetical protein